MVSLAQSREAPRWRELALAIGQTQRRVDQNRNWRSWSSKAISGLSPALFEKAWPIVTLELEIARAIASLGPAEYGLRHNIFGLSRVKNTWETLADPRPASVVWHDGDPLRLLADVLERRLIDAESAEGAGSAGAPAPPLRGRQFCAPTALDRFARGEVDIAEIITTLPALSLLRWRRAEKGAGTVELPPASPEFLLRDTSGRS